MMSYQSQKDRQFNPFGLHGIQTSTESKELSDEEIIKTYKLMSPESFFDRLGKLSGTKRSHQYSESEKEENELRNQEESLDPNKRSLKQRTKQ